MTKVYLLLRNNKQSGPYTLEEILKLGLKPLDLIWVEGRSSGWSYPSEINVLKPYVAPLSDAQAQQSQEIKFTDLSSSQINNPAYMPGEKPVPASADAAPPRKVYVSMPSGVNRPVEIKPQQREDAEAKQADKIEQKAEELRKRIQSYVPEQKVVDKSAEPVTTKYASTLPEREEAYTSWIYNQKTSKGKTVAELQKNWGSIAIAALLILIVGYGISQYHDDKTEVAVATTNTTPVLNVNKQTTEPLITEPETAVPKPITENNIASDPVANTDKHIASEPEKKVVKNIAPEEKKRVVETHKVGVTAETNKNLIVDKNSKKEIPVKVIPGEQKVADLKTPQKKDTASVVTAPKKKKTLNEKVDAFFSKFSRKKEQVTPVETSAPPSNSNTANTNTFPGTVERKAVHRDDNKQPTAVASPVNTSLADYVEVTTNKPSEGWMLGVHGLKVSLHNTGNETVKTAEVELRYYTEQNEILDKKIVNFNNILPGKTVTLPAPDHRLADHADYRLVNAK